MPPADPHDAAYVRGLSRAHRALILGLLPCIMLLHVVDRQIVAIVIEPMKRDLSLSDGAIGLIVGLAFSILYSVLGIPIARWADRGDRVLIVTLATMVWSMMTVLCGAVTGAATLLLARIGVAVGEAGGLPPTYSLVAEYFEPKARASALSI